MDSENKIEKLETKANEIRNVVEKAKSLEDIEKGRQGLKEIRDILHEGAEWWAQFDLRRGQQIVESIELLIDTERQRIKPRRRFKFSKTSSTSAAIKIDNSKVETNVTENNETEREQDDTSNTENITQVQLEEHNKNIELQSDEIWERGVKIEGSDSIKGGHIKIHKGALSLWLIGLYGCIIDASQIDGPVWAGNCNHCIIRCKCRQLRIHDCNHCVMRVNVASSPIIERCSDMRFGALQSAKDDSNHDNGRWKDVKDMSWLREGESRNWHILSKGDGDDNDLVQRALS